MKRILVVLAVCIISVVASQAFGQGGGRGQRRQGAVQRGRHNRYEDQRSDIKDRQAADEAAAEAAKLQKSAQTKATSQQTLQQSATGAPQMTSVQMQQRMIIINTQLKKLEQDKAAAVGAARSAEEIAAFDAQMESLKQEAAGLRASLGLPAE